MYSRTKTPSPKQLTKEELERQARVREGLGKYAWVKTSSEEFAARKAEEIELEEHVTKNRLPSNHK